MNVPALRFKEFSGDWKKDNLLYLSNGGFTNGVFNDPKKVGRGYKLVNVLDMYIEGTIDENKLSLIDIDITEFNKNKVDNGDVFFTRSSLVKEGIAYSNTYLGHSKNITFDGHLIRMRPKKELINSSFLNYLLRTSNPRKQLVERGKTATMTTIGQSDIADVEVIYPSLPEQTKIANFLTAVDEKISLLTQKSSLLSQYKKGVMQQIFSQELRFKDDDGQEFPEWEEKTLGELCDVKGGKRIPKGYSLQNESNGLPYITVTDMYKGGVDSKDIRYVPSEVAELIKNYKITTNDIFISVAGTLGIVGIVPQELNNANLTENANKLTNLKCHQHYLLQYLMSDKLVNLIDNVQTVGAQPKLAIYALNSFEVSIPSLPEQTKIANFLTAIDEKITNNQTQLNAVKQYKQGLLQQMFV